MEAVRRIILLIEFNSAFGRGCLRGVAKYARVHREWSLHHDVHYQGHHVNTEYLRSLNATGVIARVETPYVARCVAELGLPVVDIRGSLDLEGVPSVTPDADRIMSLAMDHFASNGFEHVAFLGYPGLDYSDEREAAFRGCDISRRVTKHVFAMPGRRKQRVTTPRGGGHEALYRATVEWLKALPKPVGVIACNDNRGSSAIHACVAAELRVPYDVAVVGVDNDDAVCELTDPPLSSVMPNAEAIGHDAATILDALIDGTYDGVQQVRVRPLGLKIRGSSDVSAVTDPDLIDAVRFIRQQVGTGINVEDVTRHSVLSRSSLERRFREHLGCTVHEYVQRVRLERVRLLLRETDLSTAEIARRCGFSGASYMIALFREQTGETPGQFRRGAP